MFGSGIDQNDAALAGAGWSLGPQLQVTSRTRVKDPFSIVYSSLPIYRNVPQIHTCRYPSRIDASAQWSTATTLIKPTHIKITRRTNIHSQHSTFRGVDSAPRGTVDG